MSVVAFERPDDRKLWGEYHEEIDRRLDDARPARSGPQDRDWMEAAGILGWARNHIPNEENIVHVFAERVVNRREGNANRRANRYVKEYAQGRRALFWAEFGPLPFTLDESGLRVRFDAATPDDLNNHAAHVRAQAKRRYEAELVIVDVYDEWAEMARRAGFDRVSLIGDLPVRDDGRLADLAWDDDESDENGISSS